MCSRGTLHEHTDIIGSFVSRRPMIHALSVCQFEKYNNNLTHCSQRLYSRTGESRFLSTVWQVRTAFYIIALSEITVIKYHHAAVIKLINLPGEYYQVHVYCGGFQNGVWGPLGTETPTERITTIVKAALIIELYLSSYSY